VAFSCSEQSFLLDSNVCGNAHDSDYVSEYVCVCVVNVDH